MESDHAVFDILCFESFCEEHIANGELRLAYECATSGDSLDAVVQHFFDLDIKFDFTVEWDEIDDAKIVNERLDALKSFGKLKQLFSQAVSGRTSVDEVDVEDAPTNKK